VLLCGGKPLMSQPHGNSVGIRVDRYPGLWVPEFYRLGTHLWVSSVRDIRTELNQVAGALEITTRRRSAGKL